MKDRRMAMDGSNKVKPLTEGYVVKGGVNATSGITTRPPAPQPMRSAAAAAGTQPAAKPSPKA